MEGNPQTKRVSKSKLERRGGRQGLEGVAGAWRLSDSQETTSKIRPHAKATSQEKTRIVRSTQWTQLRVVVALSFQADSNNPG